MKKVVGLLGSFGSRNFSEKYSFRVRTGATLPNQGRVDGANGSGEVASVERGSGASGADIIVARARLGSFSPPTPVSTVRVTSKPGTPGGGPFTMNSTRPPGGTPMCFDHKGRLPEAPSWFKGTPSRATIPKS